MGHGHVKQNEDGTRKSCGGPGLCSECAEEYLQVHGIQRPSRVMRNLDYWATPGPWANDGDFQSWDGDSYASSWIDMPNGQRWFSPEPATGEGMCEAEANARFIAAARNVWPVLCELVEAVEKVESFYRDKTFPTLDKLREALANA